MRGETFRWFQNSSGKFYTLLLCFFMCLLHAEALFTRTDIKLDIKFTVLYSYSDSRTNVEKH